MNRKPIIFLVILVVILLLVGSWLYRKYESPVQSIITSGKTSAVAVEVAKAKQVVFPDYIRAVGTLHAKQQTAVSSEIAGQILKVAYKPGTKVDKGDLLFQLDNRIYQSNLESAQAALELSKATYGRLMKLPKGIVEARQLDQAKSEYHQDQAKVDVNKVALAETQIRAPFTGFIGYNKLDVGTQIEPGEALADLIDRSELQVWFQLPEKYLSRLKIGEVVTVHAVADGKEQAFSGKLIFISPKADDETHAVALRGLIPNKDDKLAPGLFVHVTQTLGAAQHALAVPEEAIVNTLGGNQVYVLHGSKVSTQKVTIGPSVNGLVPVIDGLKTGDQVVTEGQDELKDGAVVRVVRQR